MAVKEMLCTQSCWDSESGNFYYRGFRYSIEEDSAVAKLDGCWISPAPAEAAPAKPAAQTAPAPLKPDLGKAKKA